jgi:molecular chaperone GrpE (heat shock protein)
VADGHEGLGPEGDPGGDPGGGGAARPSVFDQPHVVSAALASYGGQPEPNTPRGNPAGESSTAAQDPPTTSALIEVAIGLQDISAKQDELRELFESRIRSDEVQAKALERLHDQVREYKVNFVRQEMQPLLRDLIYCYDFAADEVERTNRGGPPPTAEQSARAFDHLRQMVADVLAKYDVEPYRSPGPEFDRREQQCVRTVPTPVEANEKKVAAVGAVGFRLADLIVRKEQVTVYKYTPTGASPEARPVAEGL